MNGDAREPSTLEVPDEELRGLFAGRRPDTAAFAAGVASRIRRAADGGTAGEVDPGAAAPGPDRTAAVESGFWTRVAAIAPGLPLLAKGKPLGALVSLPALMLVGLVLAFRRGWSAVGSHGGGATAGPTGPIGTEPRLEHLVSGIHVAGIGILLASILLGPSSTTDLVVGVLIVVILSATWCISEMGRHGLPDALGVARGMFAVMCAVAVSLILDLDGQQIVGRSSLLFPGAAGYVLAVGLWLVGRRAARLAGARHLGVWTAVGVVLLLLIGQPLPTLVVPRLEHSLASNPLEIGELRGWKEAGAAAEALRLSGLELPPRVELRGALAAAIDSAARGEGEVPHPRVLDAAVQMGILDEASIRALAGVERIDRSLEGLVFAAERPYFFGAEDRYLLDCLLASRTLDDAQRATLVRRLEASWPDADPEQDVLGRAVLVTDWLTRLGRRDLVLARADSIHELLAGRFVSAAGAGMFTESGGFCRFSTIRSATADATIDALRLMRVVGVPDGVLLRDVASFLRSQVPLGALIRMLDDGTLPLAAVLMLEVAPGEPERTVWQWLLDERLTIGCFLLVLLALRAIRIAHRHQESLQGAMP